MSLEITALTNLQSNGYKCRTTNSIDNTHKDFGAIVTGLSVSSASDDDIHAVEAAMDRYAVLIFPDQRITDEQQFKFSSRFGDMEKASGDIIQNHDRRLAMDINDISNLDRNGVVRARDDRARLFGGLGIIRCRNAKRVH